MRERALELIAAHPELERPSELVATALGRKTAGDVATAARLVADHPARVAADPGTTDADAAVVKALGTALTETSVDGRVRRTFLETFTVRSLATGAPSIAL